MKVKVKSKDEILKTRGETPSPWNPSWDTLCGGIYIASYSYGPQGPSYVVDLGVAIAPLHPKWVESFWEEEEEVPLEDLITNSPVKAEEFLISAAGIMKERGKQYDQEEGERSMGKAVQAFNIITGKDLTEGEGWLLLQILKDVRQWSTKGIHLDSIQDCIAYSALKAEGLINDHN